MVSADHGGICMYVRDCIPYEVQRLTLFGANFEVVWVKICPRRLLRGIPSIIVGTVYHQLSATDSLILNYLYELLSKIEGLSPVCSLVLLGDFNKLNCSRSDGKQFH